MSQSGQCTCTPAKWSVGACARAAAAAAALRAPTCTAAHVAGSGIDATLIVGPSALHTLVESPLRVRTQGLAWCVHVQYKSDCKRARMLGALPHYCLPPTPPHALCN